MLHRVQFTPEVHARCVCFDLNSHAGNLRVVKPLGFAVSVLLIYLIQKINVIILCFFLVKNFLSIVFDP